MTYWHRYTMADKPLRDIVKAKFRTFYKVLDINKAEQIDEKSILRFHKRVLEYTSWQDTSMESACLKECLVEIIRIAQYQGENISFKLPITPDMFVAGLARELEGCMGVQHLPIWLQLFPKILFDIIDRDGNGLIDVDELSHFYDKFVDAEISSTELVHAHADMTDNNNYPFDRTLFEQIFCNFLLCRNFNGPGKYIFGCFKEAGSSNPEKFKVKLEKYDSEEHDSPPSLSPAPRKQFFRMPTPRIVWKSTDESTV